MVGGWAAADRKARQRVYPSRSLKEALQVLRQLDAENSSGYQDVIEWSLAGGEVNLPRQPSAFPPVCQVAVFNSDGRG